MSFTIAKIRKLCTDASFERGQQYLREDRVHNIQISSGRATSTVEGNRRYRVVVDLNQNIQASCTCPYDLEGYCKHIVATLLVLSNDYNRIKKEGEDDERRINTVLAGATEQQLKDFLKKEFRDEEFKRYFLIYMTGETKKGGASLLDYKREIIQLFSSASSRYGMIEYGTELDFSLFEDLARRYTDKKNFSEAAKVYQALSEAIAENMDSVDDSDGYYGEQFDTALENFASTIKDWGLDHSEKAWYIEYFFKRYVTGEPDYLQECYQAALESICTAKEDLQYWMKLLLPYIPKVIPNSRNWSKHYEAKQFLLMHTYILDRLNDSTSKADLYGLLEKHFRDDVELCLLYVKRLEKDRKMEEAARIAEKGLELFPSHLTVELRHFLDRVYKKNDPEKYRENLRNIFFEERDWKYYDELKRITASDWARTLGDMIEYFSHGKAWRDEEENMVIEIYLREKMYDNALDAVLSSKSLCVLDRYYKVLSSRYPAEYFEVYKDLVVPFAKSRTGRDHYKEVTSTLRKMRSIKGFETEFDQLVRFLKERHANKPAFQEEIDKIARR